MWIKKGLLYNVNGELEWNKSHSHVTCVDIFEEKNILRVIFSTRNGLNQCLPSFVDLSLDTFEILKDIDNIPMFSLGKIGAFDDCGIMPTWLLKEGNSRKLYYIGWTVRNTIPYHNSVGLAKSDDGYSYTKAYEGPILSSNKDEPFFVASMCVLNHDGIYKMWYLSCIGWEIIDKSPEPLYNIKYATSINGIDWERTGHVCIGLKVNEGGISRPSVIIENGIYKMWYSYRGRKNFKTFSDDSYRIGYAESLDGLNWVRMDDKSGIDISETGWDSEMIEYPLVFVRNERKIMFYNGNGFGKTGFGYAIWKE